MSRVIRPIIKAWIAIAVAVVAFVPAVRAADSDADDAAASYVASVRAALNRGTHFPTGRDVSLEQPSGRTEVTFALTRRGKVTSVKTTQSSYSMPIDDMARQLVHRARYSAFPTAAGAGEPTHTFVVAYNFTRTPAGTVQIGEPVEVKAQ